LNKSTSAIGNNSLLRISPGTRAVALRDLAEVDLLNSGGGEGKEEPTSAIGNNSLLRISPGTRAVALRDLAEVDLLNS